MFIIAMYDIKETRVGKALKICRKYLNWVQNSVFEGDISTANIEKLKIEMKKLMNSAEDSFIIYSLRDERYSKREILGLEKGGASLII